MRRLAILPDAGGLVLRGGMLLHHWFRPIQRPVQDLDLVAPQPLHTNQVDGFERLFAETVDDGVQFEHQDMEAEGIWLQSSHPGIRLHVRGHIAWHEADIQVDITGGPSPVPAAVMTELPTSTGAVRLLACRPESIAAQKLQALWHLGVLGWRARDLDDLRLLLERVPMDAVALAAAISACFAELNGTTGDARGVFAASSWWSMKHAAARWSDFTIRTPWACPTSLSDVVAAVAARLTPTFRELA